MPQYSATYKNSTGRARIVVRVAECYSVALVKLPRWIYPNGTPHRRIGSPNLYKDTD